MALFWASSISDVIVSVRSFTCVRAIEASV